MNQIQLNHTINVTKDIINFTQPADIVLSNYFRVNKKLGREDRHEIAETSFAAIRQYQKINTFITDPKNSIKKTVLAALILGRNFNISQINDLINKEEEQFLIEVKANKQLLTKEINTSSELPNWLINLLSDQLNSSEIIEFGKSVSIPAPLDVRIKFYHA